MDSITDTPKDMEAPSIWSLPKNFPIAQQFADFFEAKIADVRKATGGGDFTTELPPATENFDQFQPCSITDVKAAIMGASSKS